MEAFSRALRQLPATVADNAGYDAADIVATVLPTPKVKLLGVSIFPTVP